MGEQPSRTVVRLQKLLLLGIYHSFLWIIIMMIKIRNLRDRVCRPMGDKDKEIEDMVKNKETAGSAKIKVD